MKANRIVLTLAAPVLAIAISAAISAVVLSISGNSPVEVFELLVDQLTQVREIVKTINRAAPYYVAAVAVAIGFKMNLFNIGVEGQYRLAGVAGRRRRRGPAAPRHPPGRRRPGRRRPRGCRLGRDRRRAPRLPGRQRGHRHDHAQRHRPGPDAVHAHPLVPGAGGGGHGQLRHPHQADPVRRTAPRPRRPGARRDLRRGAPQRLPDHRDPRRHRLLAPHLAQPLRLRPAGLGRQPLGRQGLGRRRQAHDRRRHAHLRRHRRTGRPVDDHRQRAVPLHRGELPRRPRLHRHRHRPPRAQQPDRHRLRRPAVVLHRRGPHPDVTRRPPPRDHHDHAGHHRPVGRDRLPDRAADRRAAGGRRHRPPDRHRATPEPPGRTSGSTPAGAPA